MGLRALVGAEESGVAGCGARGCVCVCGGG